MALHFLNSCINQIVNFPPIVVGDCLKSTKLMNILQGEYDIRMLFWT